MKKILITSVSVVVLIFMGVFAFSDLNTSVQSVQPTVAKESVAPPPATVPFTKITEGVRSSVQKRVNYIITSPDQLSELWKVAGIGGSVPVVDFTKEDVLAVFSGPKPVSGFAIAVARVEDSKKRMVTITLINPNEQCSVLRHATTTPYQIVAVPKTILPLFHEDETVTRSCLD